jgi:hypothetical protein
LIRMSNAARSSVETHALEHGVERFVHACNIAIENWI